MDIYSANAQLKKLIQFVDSILESDRTLYSKTKAKLKIMSDDCSYIMHAIEDILCDDMYTDSDDEFDGLEGKPDMIVSSDTEQTHVSSTIYKMSSSDKKKVFGDYANVLYQVSNKDTGYSAVNDCAKIIWMWFDYRFILSKENCPNFRYSLHSMSQWISAIVLYFAKYYESNDQFECISYLRDWSEKLVTDIQPNNYPLPYNIYKVYAYPSSEYVSLTANVIWDILIDNGYYQLLDAKHPHCGYINDDEVYRYCAKHKPECLDKYSYYHEDDSVFNFVDLERK